MTMNNRRHADTNFKYYNVNPLHRTEEDCVTRAISLATGIRYQAVLKLLDLVAYRYKCDKLYVGCYRHLLEDVFGYRPYYCDNGETVMDIAEKYKNNKVLIRIPGHLSCSIYGIVNDIWDCTQEEVDLYWIVT